MAFACSPSTSPMSPPPFHEIDFRVKTSSDASKDVELQAYLVSPFPVAIKEAPLVVLLHGANFSARSFQLLLPKLTRSGCFVLTYDARGHGKTDDGDAEPTAEVLASDCFDVLRAGLGKRRELLAAQGCTPSDADSVAVCLAGHSMGAATASLCASLFEERIGGHGHLAALAMLDMVEGSAMHALPHMTEVVKRMPHRFSSVEEAVHFSLTSGTVRLRASAAISVPYQLVPVPAAAGHADGTADASSTAVEWRAWGFMNRSIPHWEGWFPGTTDRFLGVKCPKLLVLADVESLDGALTVAQMQGKFELKLIAGAGHTLHEDAPDKVGEALCNFLSRNGLTKEAEKALLEAKLRRAKAAGSPSVPSPSQPRSIAHTEAC